MTADSGLDTSIRKTERCKRDFDLGPSNMSAVDSF